jgi:hypothetical protein
MLYSPTTLMRKFTIITGHGKLDFVKTDEGTLVLKSLNDRPLPEKKLGKLGVQKEEEKGAR